MSENRPINIGDRIIVRPEEAQAWFASPLWVEVQRQIRSWMLECQVIIENPVATDKGMHMAIGNRQTMRRVLWIENEYQRFIVEQGKLAGDKFAPTSEERVEAMRNLVRIPTEDIS